jgi:hypothetical protein
MSEVLEAASSLSDYGAEGRPASNWLCPARSQMVSLRSMCGVSSRVVARDVVVAVR